MKRTIPFHSNAVWPPLPLVIVFAVAYCLVEAGMWLITIVSPGTRPIADDMPELAGLRIVILASAAVVYAAFRLWRFHPACKPAYSAWLEMSPWTASKPLPLGPIHVVWQDALVVGVLAAVAYWHAQANPAIPFIAFGMTYLCGLNLLLAVTARWLSCLVLGFLWPVLLLPVAKGWPTVAVIAAIIVVLWHGLRASLRAFPQGFLRASTNPMGQRPTSLLQMQFDVRIPVLSSSSFDTSSKAVGWPYLVLSPKGEVPAISTRTSFFLGLLIGWWTYCVSVLAEEPVPPGVILFVGMVLAGIRLLAYCKNVTTPFNIWGRFATGRLLVPGFDRVFLTPAGVILLAAFGAALMRRMGDASQTIMGAGMVGLLWFLLLAGRPTLRNWLLTGQHRYSVPRLLSTKQPLRHL
jgi:hypothetical protein